MFVLSQESQGESQDKSCEEPGSQGLGFSFVGMVIRWGFGGECRKREGESRVISFELGDLID